MAKQINKKEIEKVVNALEGAVSKQKNSEQTAGEILASIRQHEPEEQNAIVVTLLKELAIDRQNTVRQLSDARDRAAKNHDEFMINAMGLEKILAEEISRKRS